SSISAMVRHWLGHRIGQTRSIIGLTETGKVVSSLGYVMIISRLFSFQWMAGVMGEYIIQRRPGVLEGLFQLVRAALSCDPSKIHDGHPAAQDVRFVHEMSGQDNSHAV